MIKSSDEIRKPLEVVPTDQGFHFYRGIGQYSGVTATSLAGFAEAVQKMDFATIRFHFERGDFQNWVKETLRDAELAQRIGMIKRELPEEGLRKELIERYPEKFSKSFEENKHAVVELTKGTTSRIRNQIAGYITSQCAPEEETEASGEELTDEVEAPA